MKIKWEEKIWKIAIPGKIFKIPKKDKEIAPESGDFFVLGPIRSNELENELK